MPHYLNKRIVLLVLGLFVLIGLAVTAYAATPQFGEEGAAVGGASCGETCRQDAYQARVPYTEEVCHQESVPVTHYYNDTRPVKKYYSYESCSPGSCRTVSGWYWDTNNKGKRYKHYYSRQECESQSCRTVSGWNWEEETIRASYITWEPKRVCSDVTRYKLETRYKTVCTPKNCSASEDSQCSYDGEKRCATTNQYQVCRRQANGSFKWNTPLGCPAAQVCDNGSCKPKPAVSDVQRTGGLCFSLSAAYGTGLGARDNVTLGEGTDFYLRWAQTGACQGQLPQRCEKVGANVGGAWSGSANTGGGITVPLSYSGTAAANVDRSSYGQGCHNFALRCQYPDGRWELASNVAYVCSGIEKPSETPPQKEPTCSISECSPGQCWNSGQTRSCVDKDPGPGTCYKWGDPVLSCVPGSHCGQGGQCVDDKTGEPRAPAEGDNAGGTGTGGTGTGGAGGVGGTGGPGSGGGAGFPAFGSTQCYDGKDNDNDKKIDSADPGCLDSSGNYNPNDNNEFNFRIKEIIPDFFNLNWFKVNVASFLKAEALAK